MTVGRELLAASSRKAKDSDDIELHAGAEREVVPGKGRRSGGRPNGARIDRRAEPEQADLADEAVNSAFELIRSDNSGGVQLPTELARRFATELGVDVSRVRIHTDAMAAKAAATLNAQAFTIGNDIYFGDGQYDPGSERGVHLIAHEMAHVADNQRGAAASTEPVSRPDDPHERRADEVADRFKTRTTKSFDATDPAQLIDYVRQEGHRRELPFMAELEKNLGTSLDFVDAYTGETAELARRLMAASAFAIRHVVALAEPTPQRDSLMHELAHVMQMGDSAARPAQSVHQVDTSTIHRKKPAANATATPDTPDTIKQRVEDFSKKKNFGAVEKEKLKFVGTEVDAKGLEPRYYEATETFTPAQYVSAITGGKTTDLNSVLNDKAGEELRLHKVDGSSNYFFTKKGSAAPHYSKSAKKVKVVSTWPEYFENIGKIATSSKKKIDFKWPDPDNHYEKDEPALTAEENKAYRGAMRTAIAKAFKDSDGKFDELYEHVVKPQYFSQRICGDIFEECVKESADDDMVASTDQPIFDKKTFKGIGNKKRVMGDGTLDMEVKGEAIHALVECKAYNESGPTPEIKAQMKVYKKLLGKKGYKIGGVVQQIPFNHIVYYVTTSDDDKKKKALLAKWHAALQGVFDDGEYSLVPPPEGCDFKVKYNPEFTWPIPKGQRSVHLRNPAVMHPGLKIQEVNASLDSNMNVRSGSVIYGVDAGDLKKQPTRKPLTPATDGTIGGQVDNKLTGINTKLSQWLPLEADAAIVDNGVEATLKLKKGATKGLAGFEIDAVELKALYTGAGQLSVEGTIALKHKNGKIAGSVTVGYDNGWAFSGTLDVSAGLIPGFPAFKVTVEKSATGEWKVRSDQDLTFERQFSAIKLTGTASDLEYNITTGKFSGEASLTADLGAFGTAGGSAKLKDNKLTEASISYDSPEFKYPAKSENPAFKGTVGGTLKYQNEKFSGSIRGSANLNIPALKAIAGEEGAGLAIDADVHSDGSYSGTVRTTSPLKFGKHIEVPSISCTLAKDGSMSGSFEIKIVKIKHLDKAHIKCKVTKEGVEIEDLNVEASFGDQEKGKFWGTLSAGYNKEKGLQIGGTVNYKIKEGMIATGTLKYSTETHAIDLKMEVSEITLMDKTISKTLFKAAKQIPVVNIYGLGIYIDIGFDLGFDFGFKLGLKPTVEFEGLSLETWEFKHIQAKLELLGLIFAQLTGTPKLGIGVFALDPSILRGGGGLKVPIVGRAEIKPKGELGLKYTPNGGVEGTAKVGMAASFGITGSVKPYAEFAVLNDLWNPTWEGEALAEFEILKPKELFNFEVDLAGDMTKKEDPPPLPEENAAKDASKPTGDKTFEDTKGAPTEHGADAPKNPKTEEKPPESGGDEGPFSMNALFDKLKAIPGFATAEKIFKIASKVWDVVKPVWDLVSPLFDLIGKRIEEFIDLFTDKLPKSADDILPWVWDLAKAVMNLAFGGLRDLAKAIWKMLDKAADFAIKLIDKAVKNGWIGVKRHSYYIWMPWPKDDIEFMAASEYKINIPNVLNLGRGGPDDLLLSADSAVALVLYEALDGVGIGYTYRGNSDINRPYNDFWTGDGARG